MLLATLIVYLIVLLAIGLWAQQRTSDTSDFHLAGRKLGPWVAALSASTSSSSAWSLLGVSGAAYAWGLQAFWLAPAVISGFVINWYFIAPKMHAQSHQNGALTLVEFLAKDQAPADSQQQQRRLRQLGALIILFCFTFYVAAQFQAAGTAISSALDISLSTAVWVGAVVVVWYVLMGGFWAASVTDAVQGGLMALVAVVLPIFALVHVGGPAALWQQLQAIDQAAVDQGLLQWVQQPNALLGFIFVAGLFGIGLGYPGQPHVVNRFMAMEDAKDIRHARRIALLWAVMIYTGMIALGWCGRVILPELVDRESVLLELSQQLLPAVLGGIISGGVLAAIMSTADSQLLVAGSAVSHDFQQRRHSVKQDRIVVLILGLVAVLVALYIPSSLFQRVLFAWQALGNAFGPLLIVLLWRGPVAANFRLAAMLVGFSLTVAISFTPNTPGDALERLLPFVLSLAIAFFGARNTKPA
jgi:sodium/proline symporter